MAKSAEMTALHTHHTTPKRLTGMSAPRVESATASKTMAPKSRNISGKEHNNTATAHEPRMQANA